MLEARASPGGLAEGFTKDGLRFDGGPYILLDVPGLRWAFTALGLEVERELVLRTVQDVCKEGDEMLVKVIGIDRATGKIRLSRREAMGKTPDVVHNFRAS